MRLPCGHGKNRIGEGWGCTYHVCKNAAGLASEPGRGACTCGVVVVVSLDRSGSARTVVVLVSVWSDVEEKRVLESDKVPTKDETEEREKEDEVEAHIQLIACFGWGWQCLLWSTSPCTSSRRFARRNGIMSTWQPPANAFRVCLYLLLSACPRFVCAVCVFVHYVVRPPWHVKPP